MKKYSLEDIKGFQYNQTALKEAIEHICLVEFESSLINDSIFTIHINFVILEILQALKKQYIDAKTANFLLNKVDALYSATDLLSQEIIIKKLNSEIIEDFLGVPYFNKLAVNCDEYFSQF